MKTSLVIAVALFVAYSLIVTFAPGPHEVATQSHSQLNQYEAERYVRSQGTPEAQPRIVVVGSSLAARLALESDLPCVYNLAFSGEAALTGLELIAALPNLPKVVLAEINVPERLLSRELLANATALGPRISPVFLVQNRPINLTLSYLTGEKTKHPREPVESVRESALNLQIERAVDLIPSDTLKSQMEEYSSVVKSLEAKGVRVEFFEMPLEPRLENLPHYVQVRRAFADTFPAHRMIGFAELSQGMKIGTFDGLHLTDREAIAVSARMRSYFNDVCVKGKS